MSRSRPTRVLIRYSEMQKITLEWFQILEGAFADKKPAHCGVSVGNTELGTTGRDDVEQQV